MQTRSRAISEKNRNNNYAEQSLKEFIFNLSLPCKLTANVPNICNSTKIYLDKIFYRVSCKRGVNER